MTTPSLEALIKEADKLCEIAQNGICVHDLVDRANNELLSDLLSKMPEEKEQIENPIMEGDYEAGTIDGWNNARTQVIEKINQLKV